MPRSEFDSKTFDYEGEDQFFTDQVTEVSPYKWLADDLPLWIDGYPQVFGGKRILEIGASEGSIGLLVAEECAPEIFVASDVIWRRLIAASGRAEELAALQVIAANAFELPHAAASFDIVLCNGALCHMPRLERVVAEVKRVLKPGGVYFGREPNFHNPMVRRKTLYGAWASPNMVPVYPRQLKDTFTEAGFETSVSLFWRRFPWVRNKYLAVSQRVYAKLPG